MNPQQQETLNTTPSSSFHNHSSNMSSTENNDPNLVVGLNGFTIRKPFPYKNAQGDIFCIVCCLQKGELVFQPKANFKIFRERGAVIAENSDRSILVEKLFGFKNVCGGRLCDSHYRYIMKFKNKYIPSGDSPTNSSNNDGGDVPMSSSSSTKRKKRKQSDKKESEMNQDASSLVVSTKKKKEGHSTSPQQHYNHHHQHHHQETRTTSQTPSSSSSPSEKSSSNLSLDFDHQERERDFDSSFSNSTTLMTTTPSSHSFNDEDSIHEDDTMSHQSEYSTKESKREQRYGAKRRFNFLVRLVEELVQEENIHEQYRILVEQRKQQNKVKMTHNMKQFEEDSYPLNEEEFKMSSFHESRRNESSFARESSTVTEYR